MKPPPSDVIAFWLADGWLRGPMGQEQLTGSGIAGRRRHQRFGAW
jgi:hypothetical protein